MSLNRDMAFLLSAKHVLEEWSFARTDGVVFMTIISPMNRRGLLLVIVLILAAGGGWMVRFLFFQTPGEQLARMQDKLLLAVESRDWATIRETMAEDYIDSFGHDRDSAIKDGQEVFSAYFSLHLKSEMTLLRATSDMGFVKLKIKIDGTGTPLSHMVTSRVNSSDEPWVFHWSKKGRWPWSWKLTLIQNEYF